MVVLLLGGTDDGDNHYAYIPEPEKLLAPRSYRKSDKYARGEKIYLCFNCFNVMHRESTYHKHIEWCHLEAGQIKKYPDDGEIFKFQDEGKSTRVGYTMFYDFETKQSEPESRCTCSQEAIEAAKKLKQENAKKKEDGLLNPDDGDGEMIKFRDNDENEIENMIIDEMHREQEMIHSDQPAVRKVGGEKKKSLKRKRKNDSNPKPQKK